MKRRDERVRGFTSSGQDYPIYATPSLSNATLIRMDLHAFDLKKPVKMKYFLNDWARGSNLNKKPT